MSIANFSKGTQQAILGSQSGERCVQAMVEGDNLRVRSFTVHVKHQTPSYRKAYNAIVDRYTASVEAAAKTHAAYKDSRNWL